MPWTDGEKAAFCDQQFDLQAAHYDRCYDALERLVVVLDGEDVGRLYVDVGPTDVRVLDIALLPGSRNRGAGTKLLQDVLADAAAAGRSVSLHVEAHNPARRLYDRLGFVLAETGPVYDRLEWSPPCMV